MEQDTSNGLDTSRRRRACDVCRRSKIKCNSLASQDAPCAHCAKLKLKCTFVEDSKKRAPAKGYTTCLENRCRKLELLIERVAPHVDIEEEVGPSFTLDTWANPKPSKPRPRPSSSAFSSSTTPEKGSEEPSLPGRSDPETHSTAMSDPDPDISVDIKMEMEGLSLDKELGFRFHGNSSGMDLIRIALDLKDPIVKGGNCAPSQMKPKPSRAKYWKTPAWRQAFTPKPTMAVVSWPPDDLRDELVAKYFDNYAFFLPIMHRKSVERDIRQGMHKTDVEFARLALVLLALGSRFSEDPRVCEEDSDGELDWTSAGWKYFIQIRPMSHSMFGSTTITTLQTLALSAQYLQYASAPHISWLMSGIGVRFALDIGLHRERVYTPDRPFENQIWKRTFWALISLDIMMSARLGRPCAVALEEVDAELPLEVDDEHYDELKKEWVQPDGKPSEMSCFVQCISLHRILAQTLRNIYVAPDPSPNAVADLDSQLNSWHNNLPLHLQWDAAAPDTVFMQQSSILHLIFLHNQITIHRRFLPVMFRGEQSPPLAGLSMTICTNAAVATVRTIRGIEKHLPGKFPFGGFAFGAATILLLSDWHSRQKSTTPASAPRHMEDVCLCLETLRKAESRWQAAGKLGDILRELVSIAEARPGETTSRKRGREDAEGDEGPRIPSHPFQTPTAVAEGTSPRSFVSTVPSQQPDNRPAMPSFSLIPGVPDLSAIQWDFGAISGFGQSTGGYASSAIDVPGLGGAYMGSSGLNGNFEGISLPENTFQNLFGSMDELYGAASWLPSQGAGSDSPFGNNFDWVAELASVGLDPTQASGPSNPIV